MFQTKSKILTFEKFINCYPEDGGIYELINGEIMEVNPSGKHEEIIAFVVAEFNLEIRRQKLSYFLPRTCTIKPLNPNTAYKPDIVIVNRQSIINEPLWEKYSTISKGDSIPLIIEVVSSNWRDDYGHKLIDYEALGIGEYWIIDYLGLGGKRYIGSPKQPTITIYQLIDDEYQGKQFREEDVIESVIFPELTLTAKEIFQAGV
ncbi:MAG: Uma2 family endonuclease [Crocosphaera sp.]|nr:Uma2 family endonuclease [Crocosphaera sp.]